MYCLQEYRNNSLPEENQVLIKQLWDESMIKYDIKRTQDLLLKECTSEDLSFDIDCRRRHLMNLVSLYKRFCGRNQFLLTTEYIVNQLTGLIQYIKQNENDNLEEYKNCYRHLISTTLDESDIGSQYISLCERLQLEISEAEYCSMFPKTMTKTSEWLHVQGSADEFQPKIFDLFQAIEEDLINQWSNPYLTSRTKIGVIGYTSSGKSSLINRLLGVQSLAEDGAAPVSSLKGTYFPLQFDRKEPLISPDDQKKQTLVTFVDIQGIDKDKELITSEVKEDYYLDEIRKADCDIYMLVYDEEFGDEQKEWMSYIEEGFKRKCVLVRSKVDIDYLKKFKELSDTSFVKSERHQRNQFEPTILEQLRTDNSVESRSVYLVACDYSPKSSDATMLLKEQAFDFSKLLNELGGLSFDTCSSRIHALASRTVARATNTSFRRGYVLNVLKYKVAAGFASIIPFGDQLPRYLSRDSIREAFGINDTLLQYITQFHLIIYNYKLQTSIFEKCVEIKAVQNNSKLDARWVGRAAGTALVVGGGFTEDIVRVVAPTITIVSGAARAVLTVATIGIGIIISAGVSAWSAIDSGKHIFSYINRICDDTIMVTNALITSIIEREREKIFGTNISTTDNVQNKE
jgi:GTPase SAR1 family protein